MSIAILALRGDTLVNLEVARTITQHSSPRYAPCPYRARGRSWSSQTLPACDPPCFQTHRRAHASDRRGRRWCNLPCPYHLLLTCLVHALYPPHELLFDERLFLARSRHGSPIFPSRVFELCSGRTASSSVSSDPELANPKVTQVDDLAGLHPRRPRADDPPGS